MTILSGHCSDSILGKRKDTEPCRSQFAEEEGEDEVAASEIKDAATENKDAATKYKDAATEHEDDGSENKCRVCLQVGHWSSLCPYKRGVPKGTEVVGPGWILVCWHCAGDKFDLDELKSCLFCGNSLKRAVRKFCACCRADGHLARDCPYKDMIDLTNNLGFYVPPPARAQGVHTEG